MKKLIALALVLMLVLSGLTAAMAAPYSDKDAVKKVQQALNDAGYDCGTPDGIAGKKTAAAISQYQADHGLEPTGTIDDALLESMGLTTQAEAEAELEADAETAIEAAEEEMEAQDAALEVDLRNPDQFVNSFNSYFFGTLAQAGVSEQTLTLLAKDYYLIDMGRGTLVDGDNTWDNWDYYTQNIHLTLDYTGKADGELFNEVKLIKLSFADATEHALNVTDVFALTVFSVLCGEVFGSTEDDENAITAAFAPDDEGDLSTEAWYRGFAQEGLVVQLSDWYIAYRSFIPDETGMEFIARPGSFEGSADAPAAEGDEAMGEDIPEELVELTGGLPDTLEELSDRYDIEGFRRLKAAWASDGLAAMTALLNGEGCEIPDYGFAWEKAELYKRANERSYPAQITVEPVEGAMRLTLDEVLPEDGRDGEGNAYSHYDLSVTTADTDETNPYVGIYAHKSLADPSVEIGRGVSFIYTLGDSQSYTSVRMVISYSSDEDDFARVIATKGNTRYLWTGYYDESGNSSRREVKTIVVN